MRTGSGPKLLAQWNTFRVAAFQGNQPMVQLLLDALPTWANNPRLPHGLGTGLLRQAALGGITSMFHFILDIGENYDPSTFFDRHGCCSALKDAIKMAPTPAEFSRIAAMFEPRLDIVTPASENDCVSAQSGEESIARITSSTDFGRVGMVKYYLDRGVGRK